MLFRSGWQIQKNARTVAGEIERAVSDAAHRREFELYGAGRTDAGVHALGQIAHLEIYTDLPSETLRTRINDALPSDIHVRAIEKVPHRFHARHDAISRSYLYQISRRKTAFFKPYVWWIKEPLDVERMQQAAALIAGRHDFVAFRAADPSKPDESTIVVVESAEISVDDNLIVFRIEASHFIWKMVRRLTGTLVKVGRGEVSVEQFQELLSGKKNPKLDIAAWTAPASGLFLEGVRY